MDRQAILAKIRVKVSFDLLPSEFKIDKISFVRDIWFGGCNWYTGSGGAKVFGPPTKN